MLAASIRNPPRCLPQANGLGIAAGSAVLQNGQDVRGPRCQHKGISIPVWFERSAAEAAREADTLH